MNSEMVKGAIDRAALIGVTWLLTWASAHGYISTSDVAQLTPALVVLVGFGVAYVVNRPASLAIAAANADPKTVVVAAPEIAEQGPENLVSNTCPPATIAQAVKDAKAAA